MIEIKIIKKEDEIRLDKFLYCKYQKSRIVSIQKFIKNKEIKVNYNKSISNYILQFGDTISFSDFVYKILSNPHENRDLDIKKPKKVDDKFNDLVLDNVIFQNEDILVINKPFGLPVQGGTNISVCIEYILRNIDSNLNLIHRLDKDTTGVLIIGKNEKTITKLATMFKTKEDIKKEYLLFVNGKIKKQEGVINFPLTKKYEDKIEKVYVDLKSGKESITNYKVLYYSEKYNVTLILAHILTGRTHQIRVHFKEIGCPIIGDFKYGKKCEEISDKLQLHSFRTTLKLFDKEYIFKATLPEHIKNVFKRIELDENILGYI